MRRVGVGAVVARFRGPGPVVHAVAALGASESGLARLWDEGMTGRASSGDADADVARLEAELGYGIGVWERSGVMTPHAGFGYEESGVPRYRLGTRFAFGLDLAVGLQAKRKEGPAALEHGARIDLRLRW